MQLRTRFGGQLTVDGRDLPRDNNSPTFALKLVAGAHRVIVRHPCCADAVQQILVTKDRRAPYPLHYGPPLPAQFRVINAPPDARVLVDGVLVGTASDPRPYAMTDPDQRATVTVGDRTLSVTLRAGMVNLLDYAKGLP